MIRSLYDDGSFESAGGCGRASVARGDSDAPPTWIAFAVAVMGLRMRASARRRRAVTMLGSSLVIAGIVRLLIPPVARAATEPMPPSPDADVQVVATTSQWNDGIIETTIAYRVLGCRIADCPEEDQSAVVLGGSRDGVTQIVGPFSAPRAGDRLAVRLRDGTGLSRRLGPIFQSSSSGRLPPVP